MQIALKINSIKTALIKHILAVIIIGFNLSAIAQFDQTIEFVKVVLKDGDIVTGILEESQDDYIKVLDKGVSIKILRSKIRILGKISDPALSNKKGIRINNYADNYHATQSAIGIPQGKIYFRNTLLTWNQFQYGITDNFNVSFGIDNISPFLFQQSPIMAVTPKINTNNKSVNIAAGITVLWAEEERITLRFATMTFGDRSNNFSVGIMRGQSLNDRNSATFFTVGFKTSMTNNVALKGEFLHLRNEGTLFGGSFNYNFKSEFTLGFGIIGDSFNNKFPLASFTFPIKSKKTVH